MRKSNVELWVTVKGKSVDEYKSLKIGNNQTYIEGRKGSEYELNFRNNTSGRKKIVLSVDGLNVMSGDANWVKGYVVDPWQTISIPGWRIDSSNVARFKFSSIGKSYNEHNDSGDKANVGVIGCMVFDEQPVYTTYRTVYNYPVSPWHWDPLPTHYYGGGWSGLSGNTGMIGSGSALGLNSQGVNTISNSVDSKAFASRTRSVERSAEPVEQQTVGTAWGKESEFKTVDVNYTFNSIASVTLQLYYDDRRGLERRGVDVSTRRRHQSTPNAFPGYRDGCPYPK